MSRKILACLLALFVSVAALGEETEEAADTKEQKVSAQQPQAMSGMSILGNEETPKSLVIVPWKSSELGENLSISNTLDDRARPVDKEVFLRELRYYAIRSSD